LPPATAVAKLRADVLEMRHKMRTEHPGTPGADGRADLKHAAGGIVDLEFIVQWLVLAHAGTQPGLVRNAGNFALLNLAGSLGLVPVDLAAAAANAYLAFRARQHLARNNNESRTLIAADELVDERHAVTGLWGAVFEAA
jgi:[glutamine synthetase] adenylyltransferase / [glutamine synthetase]-adenylyl-L-tyrosine phosphorylase